MYNSDTELLFPLRVVPNLKPMRGEEWQVLLDQVSSDQASLADQMSFVLMMVRLDGCVGCNADSFRAMKGCTQCARQNIKRFRGTDQELIELFIQTHKEVDQFLEKRNQPV
jgi:hypothetical protein